MSKDTQKDTQRYVMQLIVPSHLVGPIMELMAGEGIMCEAKPYEEGRGQARRSLPKRPRTNGAGEALLEVMKAMNRPADYLELGEGLAKAGPWKPTTASAALSQLAQMGKVRRVPPSKWELV